jgi:hypothetical protein
MPHQGHTDYTELTPTHSTPNQDAQSRRNQDPAEYQTQLAHQPQCAKTPSTRTRRIKRSTWSPHVKHSAEEHDELSRPREADGQGTTDTQSANQAPGCVGAPIRGQDEEQHTTDSAQSAESNSPEMAKSSTEAAKFTHHTPSTTPRLPQSREGRARSR